MRSLLDRLFFNYRMAIVSPLIAAAAFYLLFVLFGQAEDKITWIWLIPVLSAFWYGGAYLVFWIQVKNPLCSDSFLDFFELLCFAMFGLGSASMALRFIFNVTTGFVPTLCPGILTLSVIALVDKRRHQ